MARSERSHSGDQGSGDFSFLTPQDKVFARAQERRQQNRELCSQAIDYFDRQQLGKRLVITYPNDEKEHVVGYSLPLEENKNLLLFKNGAMLIVEPFPSKDKNDPNNEANIEKFNDLFSPYEEGLDYHFETPGTDPYEDIGRVIATINQFDAKITQSNRLKDRRPFKEDKYKILRKGITYARRLKREEEQGLDRDGGVIFRAYDDDLRRQDEPPKRPSSPPDEAPPTTDLPPVG